MSPTLTPQQFVNKWKQVTTKERSSYHEHFIDLCRLIEHPTPLEVDPTGGTFMFEAGTKKQGGGQGWADVWKKGYFAIEYKGKHANLEKAYDQLLQYRESLFNPPLLVVSDMETIVIHTNFTNTAKERYIITYDDLLEPKGVQRLRDMFTNPDAFKRAPTTEEVTKHVAAQFAKLADHLRKWHHQPSDIAHFLIRLLFCLFAEDVGLLPNSIFSQLIKNTRQKSTLFSKQLKALFGEMASGGMFGADEIPHFNGRLFDDDRVLELDSDALDVLERVSKQDWSAIEPAIFGTLFERSLDPAKRSQLGAHYTSTDDILLIVEPVLMEPLRREWTQIQTQIQHLVSQRTNAPSKDHSKITSQIEQLISAFRHKLASTTVLDPACGSGNFLYVALKTMLDLEKEVIMLAADVGLPLAFNQVSPEQLHGIEINEYAHELAQITVWIGYIQWMRDNGFGKPSEPILKPLNTIERKDAILAFDERGNPTEPAWFPADVIIGNPPFLGGNRIRQQLGDYVDPLFARYDGRVPASADLVTYWFERARSMIAEGTTKRAGLLATNSIRGGANRTVLERIKDSGDIFMAWSDRAWVLEGAAVRVSMVGFDAGIQQERTLDGQATPVINPDLTGIKVDITQAQQLKENRYICWRPDEKGGAFDIDDATAQNMLNAKGNPNGRPNSDVVRRWVNGMDIVRRPRSMWIVDFPSNFTIDQASQYEKPFDYVLHHVKPDRDTNAIERLRNLWWIHRIPADDMRQAIGKLERYIITPRVAKYRIFAWLPFDVLADSSCYVFSRDDDYFFGVLHSKVHELWSLRMGTWLGKGNDPRYTPTTTFETFPFPYPPNAEPPDEPKMQAIATAARELVQKRNNWLNPDGASPAELKQRTLTNLYNERPTWLDMAHRKLDAAVFAAYGWDASMSDEDILAHLLALNEQRSRGNG